MNGLLLIDKPSGWTSFDVVAKVRGIVRRETGLKKPKVGHTGTLDPLATGLLVLVIGDYCKRAGEFSKVDKTYEVTMRLGQTSTTGDEEGVKTPTPTISRLSLVTRLSLERTMEKFVGEIMQVPPVYSAIKVDGQRAYKLARAGKTVTLEPRPVTIYRLNLTDYTYPDVKFTSEVSSGTYIRSLVADIGQQLGTGAYMSNLRRTAIGDFNISQAFKMEDLGPETLASRLVTIS